METTLPAFTPIEESLLRRVEEETKEQADYRELLASWVRPMLVAGIGLAVFQQFVGINTVIYYAPTIIESTGLANVASVLATVGIGVVNVLMTIVAILVIDRVGRKPLLYADLAGMVVSLAIIGGAFLDPNLAGILSWVTLAGLMLYVASFAVSFGPLLWVMLPEIFPLKVRGVGAQQLGCQLCGLTGLPPARRAHRHDGGLLDPRRHLRGGSDLRPLPGAGDQRTQPGADRGRPA
jgi:hypothetical protein